MFSVAMEGETEGGREGEKKTDADRRVICMGMESRELLQPNRWQRELSR